MASGVVDRNLMVADYASGMTLQQTADKHGLHISTVRYHCKRAGVMRSIKDGLAVSAKFTEYNERRLGQKRGPWSEEIRERMSQAHQKRWAKKAKGVSAKTGGYVEYTRGPNKGRSVHVVKIEKQIGRRLLPNECVHHIDENKHNNEISNLELMTRAEHSRLHRLEEAMSGKARERSKNGRFS